MAGFCEERLWIMRRALFAMMMVLAVAAQGQVMATHPLAAEMERARSLEAGATATDVPHHVHYELRLYDRKGKLTTGTWDIWRDPRHATRMEIAAGDFRYTRIHDLVRNVEWRRFNTVMPLKVYDLRQDYGEPTYAVALFGAGDAKHEVHFRQVQGLPFECTDMVVPVGICFDPLAHVLAFSQMYNQTVAWEDWQPVGLHSVPRRFRIYDAGQVMVEAVGTVEVVKTLPPVLFVIPAGEPDMGEPEDTFGTGANAVPHKVVGMKTIEMERLYGNVLVQVAVGADGKVKKVSVIDADDEDIVHDAEEFAKGLVFAPEMKAGVATPFEEYIYLRHAP